ncbi:hypothetical protein [Shewanella sp.]|uniref:hypothetical protein n=1 Tax=Shewanella sp. TaxID=50422 RepID=UPI003A987020
MQGLPLATLLLSVPLLVNAAEKTASDTYSDPQNYAQPARILAEAYGDLDEDNLPEKVVVLDSGVNGGMGTGRDLLIYKMDNDEIWHLWHTSHGQVMESDAGGMMGDPFESLSIVRGAIVISHFGGSRDKWNYTHRYRYQDNDWYLIGATIYQGAPCDTFMSFDYNLLSGKAIYEQGSEYNQGDCGPDMGMPQKALKKTLSLPLATLPKMDSFYPAGTAVKLEQGIDRTVYY